MTCYISTAYSYIWNITWSLSGTKTWFYLLIYFASHYACHHMFFPPLVLHFIFICFVRSWRHYELDPCINLYIFSKTEQKAKQNLIMFFCCLWIAHFHCLCKHIRFSATKNHIIFIYLFVNPAPGNRNVNIM